MSSEFSLKTNKLLGELDIERVLKTLQGATGNSARITQSSDHHPAVYAGHGHEETSKTYTLPLRQFRGKVIEEITNTKTGNPGLEHTPDREVTFKVGEKPSRRVVNLEDNIQITVTERSDAPGEATIELQTKRHKASTKFGGNVFIPQKKFDRMNVGGSAGGQIDLLNKIAGLLENIDS